MTVMMMILMMMMKLRETGAEIKELYSSQFHRYSTAVSL